MAPSRDERRFQTYCLNDARVGCGGGGGGGGGWLSAAAAVCRTCRSRLRRAGGVSSCNHKQSDHTIHPAAAVAACLSYVRSMYI